MAIVKMQRLHLLAMEEERQSLMDALLQFGRLLRVKGIGHEGKPPFGFIQG